MRDISTGSDVDIWRLLATIFPANEILVIGQPPEASESIFKIAHESAVTVVDARPDGKRAFSRLLKDHSNAELLDIFVADETEERTFFELSIKAESGMISPDPLSVLWPNIHAKAQNNVQAEGMIELLERLSTNAGWLIVNRLDSFALCSRIEDWNELPWVMITRAALDAVSARESGLSNVPMLSERLSIFGYEKIAVLADTHPLLGQVVFARSTTQLIEETKAQLQEQQLQAQERIVGLTSELEQTREQLQGIQSQLSLSETNLQDLRGKHQKLTLQSDQKSDAISALKAKLLKLQDLLSQRSMNQTDDT